MFNYEFSNDYISDTYGMFTLEGDCLVKGVVEFAARNGFSFEYVKEKLNLLSKVELFGEATDTAVVNSCWEKFSELKGNC